MCGEIADFISFFHAVKNLTTAEGGALVWKHIPGIDEKKRNLIISKLAEKGVATNVHYKPLAMMTAYKGMGFSIMNFPNAFCQYSNEITLPLHSSLQDDEIDYVCANLRDLI